jgi:EAL domain-containing protein (putative c-di-GMP-specific phosphodiesterase class I)
MALVAGSHRDADHLIHGAEAVMQWFRGPGTSVSPEVFVALADRNGLIDKLTWHVLTVAARQAADWNRRFGAFGIAVNVTPNVIEHHDLPALTANAIGLWGVATERLTIQLTETALMQNPAQSNAVLRDLRGTCIRIAIDVFGTGRSFLACFQNIPADELNLCKSFVLNTLNNPVDRQLVQTIVALAHSFVRSVTAEGVENLETASLLSEMGCDCLQGYCFSKPVPAVSLTSAAGGRPHCAPLLRARTEAPRHKAHPARRRRSPTAALPVQRKGRCGAGGEHAFLRSGWRDGFYLLIPTWPMTSTGALVLSLLIGKRMNGRGPAIELPCVTKIAPDVNADGVASRFR